MKRLDYLIITLLLLVAVSAIGATISETPTAPQPLQSTDKVPMGRQGSAAAYTATMGQINEYVKAQPGTTANLVDTSTKRFATDAEKANWNAKQAPLANAGTLGKIGESNGSPTWNGDAWPGGGEGGTAYFNGRPSPITPQAGDYNAAQVGADPVGTAAANMSAHTTSYDHTSIPTSGQKAALAGTSGTPGTANKYVTDADTRLSNSRAPNAHAASHASGASDPVTISTSQVTGLDTALAGKQATLGNAGTLGKITESGNLPLWNGGAWPGGSGSGDMYKATYDPQGKQVDVFDRANHTGTQPVGTITGLAPSATTNTTTTANITDSTDKRFVTDAQRTVLGNTSGTNSGNVTIGTGNGLSLTGQQLSLQAATNAQPGALTAADHTTYSNAASLAASAEQAANKGQVNGYAGLSGAGVVPITQLPVGTTGTTVAAGNDARFSDARTPTAHTQAWSTITSTPTTLSGYGITDAATSAQGARADSAVQPATLSSAIAGVTTTSIGAATTAQGAKADSALQPTGNGSGLTGITAAQVGAATAAQGARVDKASADEVYATDYNGGALTSATINAAITDIGSTVKTLVLTPGDWAMSADITTAATTILKIQPGARIVRSSGTLSINGPLDAPQRQWLVGFVSNSLSIGPKVSTVYMDWMDATGDGVTEDYNPFCALVRSGSNFDIHLNGTKKYHIATNCLTRQDGVRIWGHNATVVSEIEGDVITFGGWKSTTTGQSIVFTKDARTFTIPGGVSIAVGDMVQAWNTTPYSTAGGSYYYGILTEVTGISGSTATISIPAAYTFTADTIGVVYPAHGVEIHDLIVDNSASTNATRGIVVSAKDFLLDNVEARGSTNASAGLVVEGIRGKVSRVSSRGYLGQATSCLGGGGGRPCGYGITINGHQITVDGDSTFADSKHTISMCKGQYWSSGLSIINSHLSQNPAIFGTDGAGSSGNLFQMCLDMHNNCSDITVAGNTILAAGQNAAVGVRNGGNGVRFYGNSIRYLNNATTPYSIFGVGDANLAALKLSDNTISALAANTPLIGVYDGVQTASESVVDFSNNDLTNVLFKGVSTTKSSNVDDAAYGVGWNGDTSHAPSKDAVYDKIETVVAGAGGGASTSAPYVTIGSDAGLSGERALVGTTNRITVTDGGANGNVTLSTPQDMHTSATPQFAKLGIGRSAVENGLTIGGYTATSIRQMLTGSTTNSFYWNNDSDTQGTLKKYTDVGNSLIEISPIPNDTTQIATLRFLRTTNTSGLASVDIYKANNTTTVNHRFASNGDSFLVADNGKVGIGTSTPATGTKLDVVGVARSTEFRDVVKANGTCSTSINIDPTLGGIHTLTLSGACAIGVTNLAAGQSFTLKLTQSSTTAPTFTSAYKWPAATPPTWSTSATKYDVLSCYSDDGTTLLCNGMVDVR